jgi:hypothetical protein
MGMLFVYRKEGRYSNVAPRLTSGAINQSFIQYSVNYMQEAEKVLGEFTGWLKLSWRRAENLSRKRRMARQRLTHCRAI